MDELWPLKVWANHTKWQKHVEWLLNEFKVCKSSDPANDSSPCNRFAGQALEKVYGVSDFKNGSGYLSANGIVAYLVVNSPPWKEVGRASSQEALGIAQKNANEGSPVVAVRPGPGKTSGHVALVIPGKSTWSASWNLSVPNSASFFHNDPKRSYVGKGLSHAFKAAVNADVKIYVRGIL
jgi:hypothetical protein